MNLTIISRVYSRLKKKLFDAPQSLDLEIARSDNRVSRQPDVEKMALLGQWLSKVGRRLNDDEIILLEIEDEELKTGERVAAYNQRTKSNLSTSGYYKRRKKLFKALMRELVAQQTET